MLTGFLDEERAIERAKSYTRVYKTACSDCSFAIDEGTPVWRAFDTLRHKLSTMTREYFSLPLESHQQAWEMYGPSPMMACARDIFTSIKQAQQALAGATGDHQL